MAYVDGYILPLPKKNLSIYRKMARKAGKIWKEHGALQYIESVADDLKEGPFASFPKTLKIKSTETVIFAFVVYKSRAHRDKVNAKVMEDPRMNSMCNEKSAPFDIKRMFWGGFKVIVES